MFKFLDLFVSVAEVLTQDCFSLFSGRASQEDAFERVLDGVFADAFLMLVHCLY